MNPELAQIIKYGKPEDNPYSYENMMKKSTYPRLPQREIDPRNHYSDGTLDYRVENGNIIQYNLNSLSKEDLETKYREAKEWAEGKV